MYGMRYTAALLIVFTACADTGQAIDGPVDAAIVQIDAKPDAPPLRPGECNVGNLPNSRTITLGTNDAFPSALGNELQDMIVGDRRPAYTRGYFPTCWQLVLGATAAALVDDPLTPSGQVWKLTQSPGNYRTRFHYESGEIFQSLTLDVLGDGAVDWIVNFVSDDTAGGGAGTLASNGGGRIDQPGGAWALEDVVSVPAALPPKGFLSLDLAPNGGTFLWLRGVYVTFRR